MSVAQPEDDRRPVRRALAACWALAFVASACGLGLYCEGPPPARSIDAPLDEFSAGRAMRHVEAIAQRPHPLGSTAKAPVLAHLIDELRLLGFEPEIQRPRDAAAPDAPGAEREARRRQVHNIVARWRGAGPSDKKALMLSAHYDSVAAGPGAGDDAAGVAAIMESLRALRAGPPPERDIIVLITDGEEMGLLGAEVFAEEHRWARDVGVVLNFEGRGNSGPSYMFETSPDNGWLVRRLAEALPSPAANSLTVDVYRRMPNDTDLSVFMRHGMAGLNFAFIGGLYYYHSPEDTPENLDRRSLQHHGENLLATARKLMALDLDDVRRGDGDGDAIYFSVLRRFVVVYPASWAGPLAGGTIALYLAAVVLGVRRRRVRPVEVAAGLVLWALVVAVMFGAVGLAGPQRLAGLLGLDGTYKALRHDVAWLTAFAIAAAWLLALALAVANRRWSWSWEGLGLGALGWWLTAVVASAVWLRGGSFLFVWPLLAILLGQLASFLAPRGGKAALAASALAAVPLTWVFLPIVRGLFAALSLRMAGPLMVPVLLFSGALVPLVAQMVRGGRRVGRDENSPPAPIRN